MAAICDGEKAAKCAVVKLLNCAVVSAVTSAGVSKGICSTVGKLAELVLELDNGINLPRSAALRREQDVQT